MSWNDLIQRWIDLKNIDWIENNTDYDSPRGTKHCHKKANIISVAPILRGNFLRRRAMLCTKAADVIH